MKLRIKKNSLSVQITSLCLTVSCITSLIIIMLCYNGFTQLMTKNAIQSCAYNLSVAVTSFNTNAGKIVDFVKWCESDYDIQSYLNNSIEYQNDKSIRTLFNISSVQTYEKVNSTFFSSVANYVDRLIISTLDGEYYIHIMSRNIPSHYEPAKNLITQPFFNELFQESSLTWGEIKEDSFSSYTHSFIPIIRPVNDEEGRPIGFIYLEISTDILGDPLSIYPHEDYPPLICINDYTYLVNELQIEEIMNPTSVLEPVTTDYLQSNTSLYSSKHSTYEIMAVQTEIDDIVVLKTIEKPDFISYGTEVYTFILFAIFTLIITSGIIISIIFKHFVNVPIQKICMRINQIGHGDFSKSNEIIYNNELGEIGAGINDMATKISSLLTKRIDDEKYRQELEYQILLSQINPHFLFNTLNSIKWMATIQGAEGVADMIISLSHLMKTVSKSNSPLIPLKNELDLLDDYFFIQRHRYGGGVKLKYQLASEDLKDCLILQFSLQPILENALFHGIEPKNSQGIILVQVDTNNNNTELIISITDNGVGMSPELIQKSLSETVSTRQGLFKNVGIYNVNQRIIRTFGYDYGITINSKEGYYTRVNFILPFMKK